jgi:hypothetical protein
MKAAAGLMVLVTALGSLGVMAQAVDAAKESGKAVSESAQEGGDKAKAAFASQPSKTVDKGKAQVHKAKAKYHRHKAKKAAEAAVK